MNAYIVVVQHTAGHYQPSVLFPEFLSLLNYLIFLGFLLMSPYLSKLQIDLLLHLFDLFFPLFLGLLRLHLVQQQLHVLLLFLLLASSLYFFQAF